MLLAVYLFSNSKQLSVSYSGNRKELSACGEVLNLASMDKSCVGSGKHCQTILSKAAPNKLFMEMGCKTCIR